MLLIQHFWSYLNSPHYGFYTPIACTRHSGLRTSIHTNACAIRGSNLRHVTPSGEEPVYSAIRGIKYIVFFFINSSFKPIGFPWKKNRTKNTNHYKRRRFLTLVLHFRGILVELDGANSWFLNDYRLVVASNHLETNLFCAVCANVFHIYRCIIVCTLLYSYRCSCLL